MTRARHNSRPATGGVEGDCLVILVVDEAGSNELHDHCGIRGIIRDDLIKEEKLNVEGSDG